MMLAELRAQYVKRDQLIAFDLRHERVNLVPEKVFYVLQVGEIRCLSWEDHALFHD
jgi:hypothetical protein